MRYQTFPRLSIERNDGRVTIRNPVMGYSLDAAPELVALLERARRPLSQVELGVDAQTLDSLRQRYLLIAEDEAEVLGGGLQRMAERPLGRPVPIPEIGGPDAPGGRGVAFIGAPCDAGGGPGARRGPDLMRRAFPSPLHPPPAPSLFDYELRREVLLSGFEAWDLGDVAWLPDDGLEIFGRRLHHVVARVLTTGMRPLVMGGDHSITAYILPAFLDRHGPLHLVQFDAHTDLMACPGGQDRLTHANSMLVALRDRRVVSLLQLGVRMIEPNHGNRAADARVSYRSARELARCDPKAVFSHLPRGAPCYLSFDVDVLSPFEAPNTGTPEIGGLGYYQAVELLAALQDRVRILGADFVEVAATPGALTGTNTTALIASRLMMQLALGFADCAPIVDYVPASAPSGSR